MKYWFTADTHFGHTAIICHCSRPFLSVAEMDEALIARWNAVVSPGDIVYHLGDFALGSIQKIKEYRQRLRGRIILIRGNHDRRGGAFAALFDEVHDLHEILFNQDGLSQRIVLCHYALRVWPRSHYGAWHLYGHSHGKLPDDPSTLSLDIGVDCWDFAPVPFEKIGQAMERKGCYTKQGVPEPA